LHIHLVNRTHLLILQLQELFFECFKLFSTNTTNLGMTLDEIVALITLDLGDIFEFLRVAAGHVIKFNGLTLLLCDHLLIVTFLHCCQPHAMAIIKFLDLCCCIIDEHTNFFSTFVGFRPCNHSISLRGQLKLERP